jgi:hypothetical protein
LRSLTLPPPQRTAEEKPYRREMTEREKEKEKEKE